MEIMKGRKVLAFVLSVVMVLGSFSIAFAAEGVSTTAAGAFSDTDGHWANAAITKWAGYGVLNGSDGTFRPDSPITRAEMATVLSNMMGYQTVAKNSFRDVPADAWYADAILKANAAGVLNGDGAGLATPTANITREQAALMLARAFAVDGNKGASTKFTDTAKISSWASSLVFGMEAAGYISGYDNQFNPQNNITRAEVVTIINNAVKAYYTTTGTYTENVDGLAVIKTEGVVLQGGTVNGNVIVAEGVANGNATFDGTAVKGKLVVRGGGVNSIIIKGNSSIQTISVEKVGDKVRIFADGISLGEVSAQENAAVILEGTFTTVSVAGGAEVIIKGNVTKLDLEKGAEADIQSGTVATMNIPAGATANLAAGATVKTANVTGNATITGAGKIDTANISGTGATIAQTPATINLATGASATAGGKQIGESTASTPATSGGGGGGGGGTTTPAVPTLDSLEVTPLLSGDGSKSSPFVIASTTTADDASIVVNIGKIKDDVNYKVEVSIKNEGGKERATASASTSGSNINSLLNGKSLEIGDLARALTLLSGATSSEGNDLVAIYDRMVIGETYSLTVKITPVGYDSKAATITKYLVKEII